jgi:hypothetical protein
MYNINVEVIAISETDKLCDCVHSVSKDQITQQATVIAGMYCLKELYYIFIIRLV